MRSRSIPSRVTRHPKRTIPEVNPTSPSDARDDASSADSASTPLADVDVLRAAVRRARSSDLGGIFERLVAEIGRPEASRLWLLVFSESDASET